MSEEKIILYLRDDKGGDVFETATARAAMEGVLTEYLKRDTEDMEQPTHVYIAKLKAGEWWTPNGWGPVSYDWRPWLDEGLAAGVWKFPRVEEVEA